MGNKIARKNVEDIFALTPLQQGMLFHYIKDSGSSEYIEQLSLRLKGTINVGAIKKTWNHVAQCNEMLRTVYKWEKLVAPVQVVQREYEVPVRYIELSGKGEAEKLINEIREKDKAEGTDISAEPFRVTIVKLSENEGEMIITNHHILYDGWSNGIIVKEFLEAYESILEGKEPVKRVKPRFKEYVKWQQGKNKEEQLGYWKDYLNGYEEKAVIAGYRSGEEKKEKTAVYHEELEIELKNAIEKVCREEEVTMATVINTAWGILLQRYNNTGDTVFGTTVSGRPPSLEGIEEAVGLYINTLPIRVKKEGKENIAELLKQVEKDTREREEYESLSLTEIQGAVGTGGGKSLFDTLMVIENYPIDKRLINREGKVQTEISEVKEETNYDITVGVMARDRISLSISYKENKHEEEEIKRLTGHLKNILAEISQNSRKPVEEIEMISNEERHKLLYGFNDTYAEYPKDKTIHELFEEQVERTPDSIAAVYQDSVITYQELNKKSNQLAAILREKGVKPDTIVGIMVERSLEMLIGILGILKAGGAFLPIDPEYPSNRIEYVLQDSGTGILLTQKQLREKIIYRGEIIELDEVVIYSGDDNNLEVVTKSSDLAYVIYTSGSTGNPKGVMITNLSLINYAVWFSNKAKLRNGQKTLLLTSYAFDLGYTCIFPSILNGLELHVLQKEEYGDLGFVPNYIYNKKITYIKFTPSMFNVLLSQISKMQSKFLSSLRLVVLGGEPINVLDVERFGKLYPETRIMNHYGPTETTIGTISHLIDFKKIEEYKNAPVIGKPINNAKLYIVDDSNHLQPVGAAGELCIAGDGLARGYLNRPELTAEKFVENPFEPGTRMYRTGDLARWLHDGNIEFLGRIDHQVKIRGFRIEIGEIENRLFKHRDIKEAVVAAKEDVNKNKYLCAYIVGERKLTVGELREYLGKELPDYMIPSYFIQIDKMPLNNSGKINRKALQEPDESIETGAEYEAPRDKIEEKLVKIWQEVLGVEKIGINDNFFELGGHSLKATSLTAKIHKELNVEVHLREVFKTSTVKGLAEYIKGQEENIYTSIEPVRKKEYYELSSAQKRLYTLQQLDLSSTGYNMPGVLEIEGKLKIERLEAVFRKLIERHEAFRTSFELMGEEIVQKIHKEVEFKIDHRESEEEDVEGILRSFIRPFDLSKAPLLKVELIRLRLEKHILMFDMHHIISDGTSIGILIDEFARLYEGQELSPLRIQYKDYAVWQNSILKSEVMKKQEEHWISAFEGEIPVLSLTTDYPRPAIQSFEGDTIHFELDRETTRGLRKTAKESGATMYMVLLSGFNILLSRYSGQEDIIVGSPIAGRPHADLENIMGMFVNTLAMRNYPVGSKTVKEFIEEVKKNALKVYENQDYQFEELVEKLNVRRDMSRNPVFDVMFAMQNIDTGEIRLEGINIKSYGMENGISKFDITLTAVEAEEKIRLSIQYCSRLFNKETIEKMAGHLKNILNEMTQNVNNRISEIEILGEEERRKLLYGFNDTYAEYPRDKTIHELFEEQVEKTPDNIAVIYENRQLTYKELNGRANQLARVLREKGVAPDSIVGIMVERSLEMIIGIMGILKAGGAYLPIDPEYPAERINCMLEGSETGIVLTQKHLRDKCNHNGWVIELDDVRIYQGDWNNPENINRPNDLAYVLYTSGSTGKPKGVMVEHKSVINSLFTLQKEYPVLKTDSYLLKTTYTFDVSVIELFGWFFGEGKLVMFEPGAEKEPRKILKAIKNNDITHINFVPSMLNIFISMVREENLDVVSKLKYVFAGGEVISKDLANKFHAVMKDVKLVNIYGPTEATVYATKYGLTDLEERINIPIGKPLQNTRIYIVDRYCKLQPTGTAGELCIAGDGLARGYLNRPELTAEKFLPNPFETGTRMYKTGDMARWLPDGNIEFLGRIDYQVKIRGFRIELGEIENRLSKYKYIKEAVVIAKEDENKNKYLCAYIVGERKLKAGELREYLGKELPDYMIPSYFIQIGKMPLNNSGKIDRKALPEPDGSIVGGAEYETPRNRMEEKLAEIWQEVLGAERIGINDNFFDLGGHSLKATSMVSKIHKELSIEVPLREIFKTPTIKGLTEYIKQQEKNIYASIESVEEKEYYVSSSAQKRLYALQQFDMEGTGYNIPGALEIEGKLDAARLEAVFRKLIKRHESLRTSFELIGEEVVQKIYKKVELEIEHKEAGEEDAEKTIRSFIRPFDLNKAPLLRVGLVKLHPEKHILMFDMHHIISDGTSMGILVKEFMGLYGGKTLPEPRLQYKDYAAWQKRMINSETMKKQEEYWISAFEGEIPVLSLPTDYPRPAIQSFEGDRIHFELDSETTRGLRKIAKETGATMYMVLLAGFNILLSRYSGQENIVVGSPIAGRPHADLENIMGMFVNTLAMRNYPVGNKTVSEFIEEVKANALRAYENQNYQFEELVEKLNVRRDTSRNPVFDVMFAMQNMDIGEITLEGISIKSCGMENGVSKFDITLTAVEAEEKIGLSVEYCIRLFNKDTIKRMIGHLKNILNEIIYNTNKRMSEIDMLGEEERHKLLYEFNDTYAEYPKDKTIHELFEEQVEKAPDNTAMVYENRQLTYRELNGRANQLARMLRQKGVVPNSIVGIMAERSPEMIVGILGILKAGGAYLPIDPEYPAERIKFMLEDSKAGIWLTHKGLGENIECVAERIRLDKEENYDRDGNNLKNYGSHNNLAYIMYTSGSTGKPKGVMIENRSVVRLVKNNDFVGINQNDRILQTGAIVFDATTFEIWGALLNGAVLYLADKEKIIKADKLREEIENNKITTLWLTAPLYNQIVEQNPEALAKCRNLLVGGDVLSPKHINIVRRINKRIRIINGYGPTENTTFSTCYTIEKEYDGSIPIGKPIKNSTAYILGKNMELQPVGVPGEIYLGGDGLARGYLNRPEFTAEKFVANPFEPGERLYKTGDVGRWLPDGNIEFLGRVDHQVKIRGFRIELGEIEEQLIKHEAVKEAVVAAREGKGGKYLCAYIVAEDELEVTGLMEYLSRELPYYMIPSYFIRLPKLPLTPNGKIDRTALPEPDGNIVTGAEYEAPGNETEEKLVEIWQKVLGAEKIGINDNFFELGGHSLKATSLTAKIHKELNVEIPLREIFKTPTVKGLAEYIKGQEENIYTSIEPVREKEYYELSSAQKRLYTLQQLDLNSTGYNIPGVMEIEGKLDAERLGAMFRKLINRHEALRTSFELVGEEVIQKVHKEAELDIEYKEAGEEDIEEIVRGFIRPFDLSKAPLLRAGLVKLHPEKHILMFDMHHIISDGTSMGILVKEFMGLYGGKTLPELRLQYKDYAAWQKIMINSETMKKQEEYWISAFEGEIPVLSLPTDYPRPAIQSFEGDRIHFELDSETTRGLRKIAKETGATMYMVLLSGFNILLSRYSGQEDIVVGSPIAGRLHADLENIMGMFVNTLAIRNYPVGNKTVSEFIEEVKANALRAYENQDYQFEELIEKLNVRRDMSRNPVFDVMFVMQNMDMGEITLEGISIKSYVMENGVSKFDITLTAVEAEEKIGLSIEYCSRLFNKDTIERMIGHLKNILNEITQSVNKRVSEIDILDEKERHKLLYEFNNTYAEYPRDKTIHELFEEQAARTPDNIAVVYEDSQLTYKELNEKANQLARVLRKKGVKPGNIVGIVVERSIEMIAGIIGILKAGGAYLPIDPEYPVSRKKYILEDSRAGILLTQSHLRYNNEFSGEVIELDDEEIYEGQAGNLELINKPNDIAYVIYTSGSTGKPKGVMIENKSVVNFMGGMKKEIKFSNTDRVLAVTTICFDIFVLETLLPLVTGATVIVADKRQQEDAGLLNELIEEKEISILQLTPSRLQVIKECINDKKLFKQVRSIIIGGETLPDLLYREIKEKTDARLYNVYGPTETTIWSTIKELKDEKVTIGKPLANTKIYIMDSNNNLQAVGVPGEIYLGGGGLARGYLNRPELTAEKFVANPFEPGERLYKTGDIARWLSDGNIEFIGRMDQQVKIRGLRIELGEIESQLLKHEAVKETVVLAKEDKNGSKYLCAYLVSNRELTVKELRERLSQQLPEYMIPSYFIQLEKIPLTPNGKIDRKALPEPDGNIVTGAEYEAPGNETEEKLVEIWQKVLGADRIGINDNFFDLGGHSLKATSMAAKIHKELNVEVPLREVFKKPTIKGLAEYINGQEENIYSSIEPVKERPYYELSSSQKRLYALQQLDPKSIAYNMPGVLEVEGKLNIERLQEAFRELIKRHEALRTSFGLVEEEQVQRVHKEVEFNIKYEKAEEQEVKCIVKEFISPFDLSKAPLLRALLIEICLEKCILIFDMHHIISDGVSMEILIKEFVSLYEGKELPELRIQYKDYAAWENELYKSDKIKKQEQYWTGVFKEEIPVLNLPVDYLRPTVQSFEGDNINFEADKEITASINRVAKETGTTLYMVLLAAYSMLLSKYSGQEDIVVGSPIAGRPHLELQNIIGMFVNTLPMRNQPQGNKSFREFLGTVKENALKAYENQDYQFEVLVENLNLERDLSRNPLFDTMLALQNMDMESVKIDELKFTPIEFTKHTTIFDIWMSGVERDGKLSFVMTYCTKLFKRETMEIFTMHFLSILKQLEQNIETKISDFDMLSCEEKNKILYEFNDTKADYPANMALHSIFEQQVKKTPNNTAVIFEDVKLTYNELDKRANILANYLYKENNIKSDELVGVMLNRSLHMITTIFGILKAGGAYLPIDPSYPEERIKTIINDAKVKVIISSRKYIKALNRLQWECKDLNTYLCIDSNDIYMEEEEQKNELMDESLWKHVGETAQDKIAGGGWVSSYTGNNFTAEEMKEYAENILIKLKPYLNKNIRILEIGCASGISMFSIAPYVGFYYGIDISEAIIIKNRDRVLQEGIGNIKLNCLAAHEVDKLDEKDFDIVIMNSVIHCFHGHNYLRKVISKAVSLMSKSGTLFIGDILDQGLKEEFIKSLVEFKQNNQGKGFRTKTDYSAELFIDKNFLLDLKADIREIKNISFSDKLYTIENELTRYRFDAIVEINKTQADHDKKITRYKHQHDCSVLKQYGTTCDFKSSRADNLAYVIYTSGSAGKPKGVMIEHKSIVNRLNWMQKKYTIGEKDIILQKTPYTFDVSVWELFWWSLTGAAVCMLEPEDEKDPQKLCETIERYGITTIHFVPSMLNAFIEYIEAQKKLRSLSSLKLMFSSGEALGVQQVEKFNKLVNSQYGTRLYNLYGPTEATVDVSYFDCSTGEKFDVIPIGKPIDNIRLWVVDKYNNLLSAGVPGELCISGVGLARGYLNREELTKEKFVQNPFAEDELMYKTGDLTRWLPDGNIEFIGRIDQQVKIRGFRIELGEIESQLLRHEAVKEAAVIAKEDKNASKYLCAYLVTNRELAIRELREHLSQQLPEYMIPSYFIQLEKIPLTPNGKVDRKALPEPNGDISTGAECEVPRNEIEEKLVSIWQEVLQVEKIGINDNFFEMGGHSIKAIRVVSKIYKELNAELSLREIFRYPTIKQFSENVLQGGERERALLNKLTKDDNNKELTLVCIPYGGGNSVVYQPFADELSALSEKVEVYSLALPGHDFREKETEDRGVPELALMYTEEIKKAVKTPIIVYGHCAGVALTCELARQLTINELDLRAVVIGGAMPAKRSIFDSIKVDPFEKMQDKAILEFLRGLGGFDEDIEDSELAFIMENFRNDVKISREYYYNYYPGLKNTVKPNIPAYCIVGDKDPLTKGYSMRYKGWKRYFAGKMYLKVIKEAKHYFIKYQARESAEIVKEIIDSIILNSVK